MKKSSWIAIIAGVVLVAIFALGSLKFFSDGMPGGLIAPMSQSRDMPAMEPQMDEAMPMERAEENKSQSKPSGEKIIRDIWYELRSKTFDDDLAVLQQLPLQYGGSIETIDQGTNYSGSREQRYYNVMYRIPTGRLDDFLAELERDRPIYRKYYNQYSVTDSYNQTEARLKTLKASEARYLALLEKAEEIVDIIAIEQAVSNVQSEIEWLTQTIDSYDKDIDFTAVRVNLREVLASDSLTAQLTFWDKVKDAFVSGIAIFFDGLTQLVLLIIRLWPLLLVIGGGISLFVWRRKRSKPTEHKPTE